MVEIQYQPADISQPVRYYFVRPARIRVAAAVAVAVVILMAVALLRAPDGLRSLVELLRYHAASREHQSLRAAFDDNVGTLGALQQRYESDRLAQTQLAIMLGAADGESFAGGAGTGTTATNAEAAAVARATELGQRAADLLSDAGALEAHVRRNRELVAAVPSIAPLPDGTFVLSSPFGERTSPFTGGRDFHAGIDLAARQGTPVFATGHATVVFAGRVPSRKDVAWWRMGNTVVLDHAGAYHTVYGHLHTVAVRAGQVVERGDPIATVGSTGWSTSPHLHYEVRILGDGRDSTPLDPRIFILDHGWKRQEDLLAARRWAPPTGFDSLPVPSR